MKESPIKREILVDITRRPEVLLFNNPVGLGYVGGEPIKLSDGSFAIRNPRRISFGLVPGSSDLIGCRTIIITDEMVGRSIGVFAAIEVKQLTGTAKEKQENFIATILQYGGIAGIARSVDDAKILLNI
ncbi:MAG: hypothetical protein HQL75_00465 [Magnetococcales bacterium]|nr:hypothetical protein [Magnetococcales bacterium]